MTREERAYLERRAEQELDQAENATHPCAMKAHYDLLGFYLNRLFPERREISLAA